MDDDVIPSPTWALEVASRLQGNIHAVAGPVSGLGDSFWTRYIDRNPAASKMPRISAGYVLNRQTLKRRKPPVTANFAITRELYEAVGGPDPAFTNSYEDYSWMSVMVQGGYSILCDKAKWSGSIDLVKRRNADSPEMKKTPSIQLALRVPVRQNDPAWTVSIFQNRLFKEAPECG